MCSCLGTSVYTGRRGNKGREPKADPVCLEMYEELRSVDLLIITYIKKDRRNLVLKNLSKQVRGWISNLREECPPELDYISLKMIIENVNTNP